MRNLFPHPPSWRLEWDELDSALGCIRGLRHCPQDPVFHGEGDVWTHTRMVCEVLTANPAWRGLPREERRVLFASALLHDIGKPGCTRFRRDTGRFTSSGHAAKGAIHARVLLWESDWPWRKREAVASLVRHHLAPYHLIDWADAPRRVHFISQSARCDWLTMLANADVRGRICEDQQALLDNVSLFHELAKDEFCLEHPREFASPHSRFLYFRKPDRDPNYEAFDNTRCEVILLCGLPGAGKDTWLAAAGLDWPVISLDVLREEIDISPRESQGAVIAAARDLARVHLRAGNSFIWNATNLSREIRAQVIDLAASYNARTRIVVIESGSHAIKVRNHGRIEPIAFSRMLYRWEFPDLTEAHEIQVVEPAT